MDDIQTPTQTTPQVTPTEPPAGTPGTGLPPQAPSGGVSFTPEQQAHLNRLIADERRDTEKRVKESDELKALRAKAKRADDMEEQGKSELQKAIDRAAKAEADAHAATSRAERLAIHNALTAEAVNRGLRGQPLADAIALVDMHAVMFTDDGDVKNAGKLLDAVLEHRPYLLTGAQGQGQGNGQQGQGYGGRAAPNLNVGGGSGEGLSREARIQAAEQELRARYGNEF